MSEQTSQKKESYFSRIKDLLTIGYPVIVILGYYNLASYYSHFGISIYNYVDFSEILLAFLHDVTLLIAFILLFNIVNIVRFLLEARESSKGKDSMKSISNITNESSEEKSKKSKIRKFAEKQFKRLEDNYEIIVIAIFTILILYNSRNSYLDVNSVGMSYLLISVFSYSFIAKLKISEKAKITFLILVTITIVFIFIKDKNYIRSNQIISHCNTELKSKIHYNNTIIKNDSLDIYIGETKKFLFTYNCVDSITQIIEKEIMK